MNITVNPDLQAYIDPLTPEEHNARERRLLAEGYRDALVLRRGGVLVDLHNRCGICTQHGMASNTVQNLTFKSMDGVSPHLGASAQRDELQSKFQRR
ncbi:MAG: plasmid replication/partition related protein, partial [Polaromonas sp.]|nr:plasmid replication/partition related protein [Polaromonas sp.]